MPRIHPTAWGLAALLLLGCASAPEPPPPGRATLWGTLKLAPREGVTPGQAGGAYDDPKLRGVRFVDYSKPGFAVVYVPGVDPAPAEPRSIAVRASRLGVRLEPAELALGTGETLVVRNDTDRVQTVSAPSLHRLESLAPGARLELEVSEPGEFEVFLLGSAERRALVFAAPGRWVRTRADGSWVLPALPPGEHTLVAWRRRFPEVRRSVELHEGERERVEIEIRVDANEVRDARR